jgi:hypothetical protein
MVNAERRGSALLDETGTGQRFGWMAPWHGADFEMDTRTIDMSILRCGSGVAYDMKQNMISRVQCDLMWQKVIRCRRIRRWVESMATIRRWLIRMIRTRLELPVTWLVRQDPLDDDSSECRTTVSAMGDNMHAAVCLPHDNRSRWQW